MTEKNGINFHKYSLHPILSSKNHKNVSTFFMNIPLRRYTLQTERFKGCHPQCAPILKILSEYILPHISTCYFLLFYQNSTHFFSAKILLLVFVAAFLHRLSQNLFYNRMWILIGGDFAILFVVCEIFGVFFIEIHAFSFFFRLSPNHRFLKFLN